MHSCGFFDRRKSEKERIERALATMERPTECNGVFIDTGADRSSLMRLQQYLAYCRKYSVPVMLKKTSRPVGGLGGGGVETIGGETVSVPFPGIGVI